MSLLAFLNPQRRKPALRAEGAPIPVVWARGGKTRLVLKHASHAHIVHAGPSTREWLRCRFSPWPPLQVCVRDSQARRAESRCARHHTGRDVHQIDVSSLRCQGSQALRQPHYRTAPGAHAPVPRPRFGRPARRCQVGPLALSCVNLRDQRDIDHRPSPPGRWQAVTTWEASLERIVGVPDSRTLLQRLPKGRPGEVLEDQVLSALTLHLRDHEKHMRRSAVGDESRHFEHPDPEVADETVNSQNE